MRWMSIPLLVVAVGCAGGEEPPLVDFAEIELVFGRNCVGCHGSGEAASESLDLTAGAAHAALVGVPSVQVPALERVTPGDVDGSYLWHKLNDTHRAVGGSGDPMPPYLTLSEQDLLLFAGWIEAGAPE